MHIAFVYPATEFDNKYHKESLPIGLLYLTAVVENIYGAKVDIFDSRHNQPLPDLSRINSYDVIGFTSMSMQISNALRLARKIREAGFSGKIVFGGPHASVAPDHLKNQPFIDAVFIGEAEETFPQYLCYLEGKSHQLQRIWIRDSKREWKFYPGKDFIKDLDTLPFPAREKYENLIKRIRFINMTTTRGCPFQCNYCQPSKQILFGKYVRRRSIDNIIAEIEDAKKKFDITGFSIDDDTFTFNKKIVLELCERLRPLKLNWSCQSRSDIDRETLEKMRDSGCQMLFVGVESGSQRVLDLMNKSNTVQKNEEFIKICNEVGIQTWCNMMVGYPGETKEDMEHSLQFVHRTNPSRVCVSQVTPFPGTDLWKSHHDDIIQRGWDDVARHIRKPKFKSMAKYQRLIKYFMILMSKDFDQSLNIDLIDSSPIASLFNRYFPFLLSYQRVFNFLTKKQLEYYSLFRKALDSVRSGNIKEGLNQLEDLRIHFPSKTEILGNLGWIYLTTGNPHKAIESYKCFLDIEPDNPEVHFLIAKAFLEIGQIQQARAELIETIRLSPNHKPANEAIKALEGNVK